MNTPLQQKIFEYIRDHIAEHEYSPSLEEIARGIGISPKSISLVSRHVHALVAEGRLQFHKKGYRNIQVVEEVEEESFSLPLLGRIAAGVPILAMESRQDINLRSILKGGNHFLLEVEGDSMVEEGILDGDYVICRHQVKAEEGEIVVALIDEQEATLKRISYKIADRITLIPANASFKPKAYLPNRVQIQGVFTGLLRLKI